MYVTNKMPMANIEVFNGPIRLNSDRDTLGKCFYLMSGNVIIICGGIFAKLNLTFHNPPNVFETQRTQIVSKTLK